MSACQVIQYYIGFVDLFMWYRRQVILFTTGSTLQVSHFGTLPRDSTRQAVRFRCGLHGKCYSFFIFFTFFVQSIVDLYNFNNAVLVYKRTVSKFVQYFISDYNIIPKRTLWSDIYMWCIHPVKMNVQYRVYITFSSAIQAASAFGLRRTNASHASTRSLSPERMARTCTALRSTSTRRWRTGGSVLQCRRCRRCMPPNWATRSRERSTHTSARRTSGALGARSARRQPGASTITKRTCSTAPSACV